MINILIKHLNKKYGVIKVELYHYTDASYMKVWFATAWDTNHSYVIEQQWCYNYPLIAVIKLARALKEKFQ